MGFGVECDLRVVSGQWGVKVFVVDAVVYWVLGSDRGIR